MSQMDVLKLLVNILIIVAFFRLCVALVPLWVLGIIGFLVLIQFRVIDPALVASLRQSSSPLFDVIVPFLIIVLAFYFLFAGLKGRR